MENKKTDDHDPMNPRDSQEGSTVGSAQIFAVNFNHVAGGLSRDDPTLT